MRTLDFQIIKITMVLVKVWSTDKSSKKLLNVSSGEQLKRLAVDKGLARDLNRLRVFLEDGTEVEDDVIHDVLQDTAVEKVFVLSESNWIFDRSSSASTYQQQQQHYQQQRERGRPRYNGYGHHNGSTAATNGHHNSTSNGCGTNNNNNNSSNSSNHEKELTDLATRNAAMLAYQQLLQQQAAAMDKHHQQQQRQQQQQSTTSSAEKQQQQQSQQGGQGSNHGASTQSNNNNQNGNNTENDSDESDSAMSSSQHHASSGNAMGGPQSPVTPQILEGEDNLILALTGAKDAILPHLESGNNPNKSHSDANDLDISLRGGGSPTSQLMNSLVAANGQNSVSMFQIPWDGLPDYVIQTLEEGRKLDRRDRLEMIRIVCAAMEVRFGARPARGQIAEVARDMVAKYPQSLRDEPGEATVFGQGYDRVFKYLEARVVNSSKSSRKRTYGELVGQNQDRRSLFPEFCESLLQEQENFRPLLQALMARDVKIEQPPESLV